MHGATGARRRLAGWAAAICVVTVVGSCAAPGGLQPARSGNMVAVPAVPIAPARSFTVDLGSIEAALLDAPEPQCDPALFFYGVLPRHAMARLADPGGTAAPAVGADRAAQLGSLFVSGWFGGLYLRANLASIGAGGVPNPLVDLVTASIAAGTVDTLDSLVADLLAVADGAAALPDGVRSTRLAWGLVLAAVYGYNLGYLETLSGEPVVPEDVAAGWGPDAAMLREVADASIESGRAVWRNILSRGSLAPAAQAAVIELSEGFLELTADAMAALAAGPDGLVVTAGLVLWAGSYFAGLAAPPPPEGGPHELPTVLPTAECA